MEANGKVQSVRMGGHVMTHPTLDEEFSNEMYNISLLPTPHSDGLGPI